MPERVERKRIMKLCTVISLFTCVTTCAAFSHTPATAFTREGRLVNNKGNALCMAKGFGEEKPKPKKSQGQVNREQKADKYDEIAATGGQEYNIFVRQFGGDDKSWLPCGAIAVPRAAQVSDAVFENEDALKKAIVRTYPKLAGYEQEFEYGFNLKIYPDDTVEIAMKGGQKSAGPSIGNWISNLLSPVDASKAQPPTN